MKFSSVLLSATFALCALPAAAASMGSSTPPSCPGDQPVWVNTKSKAYHTASDPLYGKTTHGAYMCKAAADAAGDHMSGSKGSSKVTNASSSTTKNSSSMTGTSGNSAVMGGTAGGGSATTGTTGASPAPSKHHHHHKGGSTASPAPAAT